MAIALIISVLQSPSASAEEDYLLRVDMNLIDQWNNNETKLLPITAQMKQVRYRILRSNPDNLIGQIVLQSQLKDKQELYNGKWYIGLWIYGQALYCASEKNCNFILNIYPQYPKSIRILSWTKSTDEKSATSDCPGQHYITEEDGKSILNFTMSISCLNLPKQFASYAYSGYDIGITPIPYGFTAGGYVDNPFHQLAKSAYDSNGGKLGLSKLGESEALQKLKSSIEKARLSFDNFNYQYQNLAPQIQSKIGKSKDWKNFQKMEEQLSSIESDVEDSNISESQILAKTTSIIKIINSQISGLKVLMKLIPTYQCYNEDEDLRTILSKTKTCPKGYAKVKTSM